MLQRSCRKEAGVNGGCSPGEGTPGQWVPSQQASALCALCPSSELRALLWSPGYGSHGLMHHHAPHSSTIPEIASGRTRHPRFITIAYCVALGKWLNLSEPQFHLLEIRI